MIVRKLRLQRGWSQDQLAELTGLSVRTVQRIERGGRPSLESARALAAVFEVDASTFTQEIPTMNPQSPSTTTETKPASASGSEPRIETLTAEESAAIEYAGRVQEFFVSVGTYAVLAIVFFAVVGFGEPILYWIFGGLGIGLLVQGLIAFERIRLPWHDWERRLAERKLGRKL